MLAVSLYEKFILFPVATKGLQMRRQHVEALADASFLYGTNRNASHATDAKLLVVVSWIFKRYSSCGAFSRANSTFSTIVVGNRIWT